MRDGGVRPLRADAERNRRLVLTAAAEEFAEHGLDASAAKIARRAGVGAATLFRRFPTKEHLILAIIEERVGELQTQAAEAARQPDPWSALERLLEAGAALQARDRGVLEAVVSRLAGGGRLWELHQEVLATIRVAVERAHAAGVLRADVVAEDLAFLMSAAARSCGDLSSEEPELWRRYLALMLAGLRPAAASPLPLGPPGAGHVDGRRMQVAKD